SAAFSPSRRKEAEGVATTATGRKSSGVRGRRACRAISPACRMSSRVTTKGVSGQERRNPSSSAIGSRWTRRNSTASGSSSVARVRQRIRDQRIRDTARRQLLAGRRGDRTSVSLSKQAAFVGVVNFAAGSPLGDILLEIESDDLSAVIDNVAESTVDRKG